MMIDLSQRLQDGVDWLLDNHLADVFNLYPPFLGAGIRVDHIADDFRRVEVRMPLTPLNRNVVGTQMGGSLYTMCDPFYMIMLMQNLGDAYVVWDKSAEIRFLKPGRGTVYATFELDQDEIDEVRRTVDEQGIYEPVFRVDVVNDDGDVVAEVDKTIHVRKKD